jgi:hypothetical protein
MTNPPHVHTLETKSLRKQDAQNGSTMSGFGRHLTDFLKYVNYEMPAEEARESGRFTFMFTPVFKITRPP